MMLDKLKLLPQLPDKEWLMRLQPGHFVWDVKDQRWLQVRWSYAPPNPGHVCGRIAVAPCWTAGDQWGLGPMADWYVHPDGTGMDGSQILWPATGNCPDEPVAQPEPWQRWVERQLEALRLQLDHLRRQLRAVQRTEPATLSDQQLRELQAAFADCRRAFGEPVCEECGGTGYVEPELDALDGCSVSYMLSQPRCPRCNHEQNDASG